MSKPGVNVYTAGYSQWKDQEEFFTMVHSFKALLIDVRLYPVSRHRPEWSKEALQQNFSSYIHVRAYGNESFGTDKPAKLLNPGKAAEQLNAWVKKGRTDFLFLCACANHNVCHRSLAAIDFADFLRRNSFSANVHHLKPGGQQTLF